MGGILQSLFDKKLLVDMAYLHIQMAYLFLLQSSLRFKELQFRAYKKIYLIMTKGMAGESQSITLLSLDSQVFNQLARGNLNILQQEYSELDALGMKQSLISILREIFSQSTNLDSHLKAIVIDIKPERVFI